MPVNPGDAVTYSVMPISSSLVDAWNLFRFGCGFSFLGLIEKKCLFMNKVFECRMKRTNQPINTYTLFRFSHFPWLSRLSLFGRWLRLFRVKFFPSRRPIFHWFILRTERRTGPHVNKWNLVMFSHWTHPFCECVEFWHLTVATETSTS